MLGNAIRVWNENGNDFTIARYCDVPVGYLHKECPMCQQSRLTGAIVCLPNGSQVIPSADDSDPSILC